MSVEKKDFIYEGKAKQVYSTTDENLVIITIKMMQQQEMELKKEQ
jgi:phosphoribosylaminoimidazole-succinocarboxamide synthase